MYKAANNEASAVEHRKLTKRLLGRKVEKPGDPTKQTTKLLELPPKPGDRVIGFACCEIAYSSLRDMIKHMDFTHLWPVAVSAMAAGFQSPVLTEKQPRPRAIEMKAPVKAEDTKTETQK